MLLQLSQFYNACVSKWYTRTLPMFIRGFDSRRPHQLRVLLSTASGGLYRRDTPSFFYGWLKCNRQARKSLESYLTLSKGLWFKSIAIRQFLKGTYSKLKTFIEKKQNCILNILSRSGRVG